MKSCDYRYNQSRKVSLVIPSLSGRGGGDKFDEISSTSSLSGDWKTVQTFCYLFFCLYTRFLSSLVAITTCIIYVKSEIKIILDEREDPLIFPILLTGPVFVLFPSSHGTVTSNITGVQSSPHFVSALAMHL